jgi:ABC-type antimicrobial peptide transport system permease subunit
MQQSDNQLTLKDGLGLDVVMRANIDSTAAIKAIQSTMRQMNREQVVSGPQTMDGIIADTLAGQRFSMILLAVFAGLALVLASIGMYGVISYLVGQRTQEIGVRMALGASRSNVLVWVLRQGGRLTALGAGTGLIAALALTQVMTHFSLIYGVRAYDPWTLGGVTLLLMLVAFAACCVPAMRAMGVDPMRALRAE